MEEEEKLTVMQAIGACILFLVLIVIAVFFICIFSVMALDVLDMTIKAMSNFSIKFPNIYNLFN